MHKENQTDACLITIRDDSFPPSNAVEALLKLSTSKLTAKDLVAQRVQAECDNRLRDKHNELIKSLVDIKPKEQALNGKSSPELADQSKPYENAEKQIEVALTAFEANGFFILVDDIQIETLDEVIDLNSNSVVTFLKLTPLIGG